MENTHVSAAALGKMASKMASKQLVLRLTYQVSDMPSSETGKLGNFCIPGLYGCACDTELTNGRTGHPWPQ